MTLGASWTHITSSLRLGTSSERLLIQATRAQVHNSSQRRGRQEATRCACEWQRLLRGEEARLVCGEAPRHPEQDNGISPLATERTSSIGVFKSGLKKNNEHFLTSAKWGSDMHPRDRRQLNGTLFSVAEACSASTPDGKGPARAGNHHPTLHPAFPCKQNRSPLCSQ